MSRQTVLPRVVFPGRLASAVSEERCASLVLMVVLASPRRLPGPGTGLSRSAVSEERCASRVLLVEGKRYCIRLSQASSNCCWPAAHSNKTSLFGRFFPILFEQEDYNLSFKRNKMSCPTSERTLENTKTEIHVLKNQVSF